MKSAQNFDLGSYNAVLGKISKLNFVAQCYQCFDTLQDKNYPSDLVAERIGENDKLVEYLDALLKITEQGSQTSAYQKVDNLNFLVILFTFPNSQNLLIWDILFLPGNI